jgi:hypothetical protein
MGLSRLELLTFPLSEGCSNRLSYRPILSTLLGFSAFSSQLFRFVKVLDTSTTPEETGSTCFLTPLTSFFLGTASP